MSANGKNDFNHLIPKKELPFHKKASIQTKEQQPGPWRSTGTTQPRI